MLVKTLKGHSYDRRGHKQGEEYHIDNPKHVKLLVAVGKIKVIPETVKIEKPVKFAKESVKKTVDKKTVKLRPKTRNVSNDKASSYSRKDMQAESIKKSKSKKRK